MNSNTEIKFNEPAYYKISVQGKLTDSITNILGKMKLTSEDEHDGIIITTLEGTIRDQAELSGIIDTLYSWRYPIIKIEFNANNQNNFNQT